MKIGIIGAGNVGGALGQLWAGRGHDVCFGVRDPNSSRAPSGAHMSKSSVADAARHGELVVFATPWGATLDAVRAAGDLDGRIVVDTTNPLLPQLAGLAVGLTTSAAEEIARAAPGARVVKCFNNIGAQNFANPKFGSETASMFMCGDDAAAKAIVSGLGAELGFDMVDAGPLTQARLLEPLAMLWISLAYQRGFSPNIGFKLLRR